MVQQLVDQSMSNSGTERELVERVQSELPYVTTGFSVLMRAYEARVLRTCRRLLGNPHDAEEVYQEILIRVFHGLKGFKQNSSFSTWLFRIAHNECMTRLRKLSREKQLFIADDDAPEPIAPSGDSGDPELGRDIERVLARMSFGDREILTLRFVSDLPIADIARVLSIKLSATKMRLSRASARFAELLNLD